MMLVDELETKKCPKCSGEMAKVLQIPPKEKKRMVWKCHRCKYWYKVD